MDTNEMKGDGFIIIPKQWLSAIEEKQDKILSLLETSAKTDDCVGDYITEDEAKRQLGRKTTWFWSMRTTGQLPYSKIGKKIFYLRSDIKKLLEKNAKSATGQQSPELSKVA